MWVVSGLPISCTPKKVCRHKHEVYNIISFAGEKIVKYKYPN